MLTTKKQKIIFWFILIPVIVGIATALYYLGIWVK